MISERSSDVLHLHRDGAMKACCGFSTNSGALKPNMVSNLKYFSMSHYYSLSNVQ